VQVYSLQRDHNLIDLPEGVVDLQHFLLSWEDTMGAIDNLDIVITSCTSIAHLAAAMGKETWVIVPVLPYHTWTPGSPENNKSVYYDCVTLFRQKESRKWNDTFQELYSEFEKKFNLDHVDMPNEDKEFKKLNMGSGLKKLDGFLNVDISESVKPDQVVDLNVMPWPWKDNEFDHIVAKDILEHLGNTPQDFVNVIKEMYRVSNNGAVWEIAAPHWRCDTAIDDPTHVRAITPGMFNLFNMNRIYDKTRDGESDSPLAFDHNVDIELCDVQFEYIPMWLQKLQAGEITQDQLVFALNHYNNVALSTRFLIQVHKPGRFTVEEYEKLVRDM
jgi:predicted SAM-dependent methyltransferase